MLHIWAVSIQECTRKASLLFPYLPPVQPECRRRHVPLTGGTRDEEAVKTAWAQVACKSMRAGTSPVFFFHVSDLHSFCRWWQALNVSDRGMEKKLHVHNPSRELNWEVWNPESRQTAGKKKEDEERPLKRADLASWWSSAQKFRMSHSLLRWRTLRQDIYSSPGSPRGGWGISTGLSF